MIQLIFMINSWLSAFEQLYAWEIDDHGWFAMKCHEWLTTVSTVKNYHWMQYLFKLNSDILGNEDDLFVSEDNRNSCLRNNKPYWLQKEKFVIFRLPM